VEQPAGAGAAEASAEQRPTVAEPKDRIASHVLFAEAFGVGLLYSLNYEYVVDAWHVGFRGGASFFTYATSSYGQSGNLTLVSFPAVASYYLALPDHPSHRLQLGLGATLLYLDAASDSQGTKFGGERAGVGLAFTGVVGYRYQPRDGGVIFGIGFTPLVRTSRFLPWGGASVGYAF